MKVKALRGVCIGVDRHLKAGDIHDLDPALLAFLVGIGAVEVVKEAIPKATPPQAAPLTDTTSKSIPDKSGSKEK